VSPNLTYPKEVKAAANKVLAAEPHKRTAAETALKSSDPAVAAKASKDLTALDKAVSKAHEDLAKWGDQETSFMGLQKPLFGLKNPGLFSIPLGFLGAILGSLLMRDRRAEARWNEVHARQNIGLVVSKPAPL
jgi:cation/acetate symporter